MIPQLPLVVFKRIEFVYVGSTLNLSTNWRWWD